LANNPAKIFCAAMQTLREWVKAIVAMSINAQFVGAIGRGAKIVIQIIMTVAGKHANQKLTEKKMKPDDRDE